MDDTEEMIKDQDIPMKPWQGGMGKALNVNAVFEQVVALRDGCD